MTAADANKFTSDDPHLANYEKDSQEAQAIFAVRIAILRSYRGVDIPPTKCVRCYTELPVQAPDTSFCFDCLDTIYPDTDTGGRGGRDTRAGAKPNKVKRKYRRTTPKQRGKSKAH